MDKEYKQLKDNLKEKGCTTKKSGRYITVYPPLNVNFYTLDVIKELKIETNLNLKVIGYSHFNTTIYYVRYKIL